MTLRKKILSITVATFLVALAVLYASSQHIILGGFAHLEQENIDIHVKRVNEAFTNEIDKMTSTAGDWAPWDDTRDFVKGTHASYVEENLNETTLVNLGLNFMIFYDNSNKIVHKTGVDLNEGTYIEVPEKLTDFLDQNQTLLTHNTPDDSKTGIAMSGDFSALISCWPITNNNMEMPANGTLVVGKFFDDQQIAALAERTRLPLTFTCINSAHMTDDLKTAKAALADRDTHWQLLDESTIAGYSKVNDILEKPCYIVKVDMSRDIFMQGKQTSTYFISSLFAVCLVLLGVLSASIQKLVLSPVAKLEKHFLKVAETDDMTLRLDMQSNDEFGTLSKHFDDMVGELSDTRKKLMELSYQSGMAEMASGAIHNVRNTLTHVTTEIGQLTKQVNNIPVEDVQRAKDELKAGVDDPQRKADLDNFIEIGCNSIFELVASFRCGLNDVTVPITRIEQMLADQETVSHSEQPLETFRIDDLLAEVIKMMPKDATGSISIELDESLEGKTMKANRISLVQIFSNLLLNAADSIAQAGKTDGKITIGLETCDKDGVEMSEFILTDNGTGIGGDDLRHIFKSGYSTKEEGHSGLGLHWCANTLNAVGGNIYAENCPDESGASFHVLIPQNE